MKQLLVILLIFQYFFSYSQDTTYQKEVFDIEQDIKSTIGKQFGEFKITTSDMTVFSNCSLSGKVVFVNFWFANCPPCISELEGFNQLFDSLKNNDNFRFVSFTFDSDSVIQNLRTKYNIKYRVIHIDRSECYRLNFNMGFPTSFILDRKGIINYTRVGGQLNIEESTKEIMTEIYPILLGQL